MESINVLVVEPFEFGLSVKRDTVNDYKDYYKLGGFSMFDVVRTKWDGEDISIFLDDEGLFKPNNLGVEVKGVDSPLFGTLIITGGTDDEGRTLSIPDGISMHDIHSFISEVKYVTSS